MNRLDGKVALISGGARGQGSDEAKLFAQEGAAVVIGDILDEEGHKLEAEINESGGSVMYVHLDVTNELNWTPQETFKTGLEKTVKWYVKNDSWWKQILDNSYDGGRLGLSNDRNTC